MTIDKVPNAFVLEIFERLGNPDRAGETEEGIWWSGIHRESSYTFKHASMKQLETIWRKS